MQDAHLLDILPEETEMGLSRRTGFLQTRAQTGFFRKSEKRGRKGCMMHPSMLFTTSRTSTRGPMSAAHARTRIKSMGSDTYKKNHLEPAQQPG